MRAKTVIILLTLVFHNPHLVAAGNLDSLVWPSPPDRARLKHLVTLSSEANFHEENGTLSKVLHFFFGGEQQVPWLVQPVGIAVSKQGIIYVADPGSNGVHRIDQQERKHTLVTETKYGNFRSPVGIACADEGSVYITDSDQGVIIVTDGDLEAKSIIKGRIIRPTGISIIRNKLYVVDTGTHKIVVLDLQGNFLGEFGQRGTEEGNFNYPVEIAGRDTLCVVDALNYRIQLFTPEGKFLRMFGRQGNAIGCFASPKGVALDSDGDIYVTDALLDNLQIFNMRGQLLLSVGQRGTHDGEFLTPNGIAIDAQDRIYIVDTLNRRIQIFQYLK
jgi:DNA-binding beta-propeller fold protein YncE